MKALFYSILAIIVAVLLPIGGVNTGTALADDGYQIVTTVALKEWMASPAPPVLIYSLSQVEYEEQRIPGSICIPMELMQADTGLPSDKNRSLVFYCKGPG